MSISADKPLRWGIVSAGRISHDFALALTLQPPNEHKVEAIAARSLERAQDFAKKIGIPKAYGSYEELAKDSDIDVVYIGSVNPEHLRQSKMMLEAGKHVVCEKPVTVNGKQLQELLKVARQSKRFFMEGLWSRFFPVYEKIRQEVKDGTIGDVKYIEASFGFNMSQKERVRQKALAGGALLDIGIYPIQLATMLLGGKPDKIIATGSLFPEGTDDNETVLLVYKDGKRANLTASGSYRLPNTAVIVGTEGMLEIPSPMWCPETLITPKETLTFPLPKVENGSMIHANSQGFMYEQKAVREAILKGQTETEHASWADSEAIQAIMDEARRQLGVVYDEDNQ